jgi:hypothetical protein
MGARMVDRVLPEGLDPLAEELDRVDLLVLAAAVLADALGSFAAGDSFARD